jgi:photosynthetic reaction center cytochrome c subunit
MKTFRITMRSGIALGLVTLLSLGGCERPPVDTEQGGYRGLGMVGVTNPRIMEEKVKANVAPEPAAPPVAAGPKASEIYSNVQVLGDLSVAEFTGLMTSITEWVSPEQGCAYCHVGDDFASEDIYTKQVARVMIDMTQRANEHWQDHVGETGVTCYTCHRGKPVPEEVWTNDPGPPHARGLMSARQNIASSRVGYTSLPYDPLTPFLEGEDEIRVVSNTALPEGNTRDIKDTEWTYGLMMHFSDALGVNCTHCHNTRSFSEWDQSPPERLKAWHAIRQVREINDSIAGTSDILPDTRKGPLGDALKVNCATCHQGVYKPLFGAQMAKSYPSLLRSGGSADDLTGTGQN